MNFQKIGNIDVNLSFYKGEDLYSEGKSEDELLEIVKNYSKEDFNKIIYDRKKWSLLYHLSDIRSYVVEWIPINKNETILEIGSGCGAITGILGEKAKKVTCIELSKKRSLINAYRNKEKKNIEIIVGNFQDIEITEKYDYITLIGVFEYAASYIKSKNPYDEFLNIIKKYLKPNGKIIIAIENKLGLKYWAGCKEDHTGRFFDGLEDYLNEDKVKTFSKRELKEILENTGFLKNDFYYPYPDYKLPSIIYSDSYLPKQGELNSNMRNFDNDRLILFDERAVFDTVLKAGLFSEFSNSFIVMASISTEDIKDKTIYVKYSDSRDKDFKIRTSIIEKNNGKKIVEKKALNIFAQEHINKIALNSDILKKQYKNAAFNIVECRKNEEKIEFDYIEGKTFSERLQEKNSKKWEKTILPLMESFKEKLNEVDRGVYFEKSPNFISIFGDVTFDKPLRAMKPANIDLIGSNIIINNKINIIDYEWIFDFYVPINYVIFRILHHYQNENTKKNRYELNEILEKLDISKNEQEEYSKMEKQFIKYITKKESFLPELYAKFDTITNVNIGDILLLKSKIDLEEMIQIFENNGKGYREEYSYWLKPERKDNNSLEFQIPIDKKVKEIRIDPTEKKSIIILKEKNIEIVTNGVEYFPGVYVFKEGDPQLLVSNIPQTLECIKIKIEKYELNNFVFEILEKIKKNEEKIDGLELEINNLEYEVNIKEQIIQNILNSRSYKFINFAKKLLFWRK